MSKNPASKLLSNTGRFSKLQPLIFVAIFALAGVAYLLATHALSTAGDTVAVKHVIDGVAYNPSGNPYTVGFTWTTPNGDVAAHCNPASVTYGSTSTPGSCLFNHQTGGVVIISVGSGLNNGGSGSMPTFVKWTVQKRGNSYIPCTTSTSCTITFSDNGDEYIQLTANYSCPAGTKFATNDDSCHVIPPPPLPPPPTPPTTSGGSGGGSVSSGGSTTTTTQHTSGSSSSHKSTSTVTLGSGTPATSDSNLSTTDVQPATDNTNQPLDFSANPNVPAKSDSTVKSSDNLVSVTFPKGTFGNTDAYCSIDQGDSHNVPFKTTNAIGPYSIDCTDSNGSPLNNFKKSVTVAITLPANKSKYTAYVNDSAWVKVASSNNGKTLSFKLAKAQLFAAATTKTSSAGTIILNIIGLVILLLFLGGFFLIRRRRHQSQGTAENYWQ